jgi:hypothetical protein
MQRRARRYVAGRGRPLRWTHSARLPGPSARRVCVCVCACVHVCVYGATGQYARAFRFLCPQSSVTRHPSPVPRVTRHPSPVSSVIRPHRRATSHSHTDTDPPIRSPGLVGITSACSVVEPWAAVIIGAIGAVFYTIGAKLCLKLRIDDPVNATAVHFFAGMWGLLAPAFFAKEANMIAAYAIEGHEGLFYGGTTMLGTQLFGLGAVVAWVTANMLPFFILLKIAGVFRVSAEAEEAGMDASEHGGAAYNIQK